jgi:hypothetical protein
MSDMKAFETHTYHSGKWKINSGFDDRDLAMFEAQRMDESGRDNSIRVVEKIYVESAPETKPARFSGAARSPQPMPRSCVNSRKAPE